MDRFSDDYRPSSRRRGPDALEDGLDRLVTAGRQLVDGVSGARPGSRRRSDAGAGGGATLPRLGDLGRWVEERLDGLLDADDDGWREPWQQSAEELQSWSRTAAPAAERPRRRPLEAISRRMRPPATTEAPAAATPATAEEGDWPSDDDFTLPRWQRDPRSRRADGAAQSPRAIKPSRTGEQSRLREQPRGADGWGIGRPLPRSSRQR